MTCTDWKAVAALDAVISSYDRDSPCIGGRKTLGMAEATPAAPWSKTRFREAILDSSEMIELVEAMGDVLAAAGNLTLRFRVSVEFADG
jgi:hypothetical protein